jgi:hypothetical protein
VVDRESRETGQKVVTFSGVVRSQSLSGATAKLDDLRDAVLAQDAYKDAKRVRLRAETRVNYVSANADGGGVPSGFLEMGFDEEWLVFTAKSGAISMQYARRTESDYLQLQKTTTVQGSVFGPAAVLAGIEDGSENNLLDLFLAGHGAAVKREVGVDREWTGTVAGQELATDAEAPQKVDFTVQYVAAIDGGDSILEAQMTESVEYAGTRWVEQPLPDGPSLMQNCGVQAGRRTVSGSVTAGSREAAENWAKGNRALLFAQRQNPPSPGFEQPLKLDLESMYLPRSGTAVRLYRLSFTFAEVLPAYGL